jgi:cell wall assembly regulator SMI1
MVYARPPVSADDLAAAERRLAEIGHPLPASYKAFLTEHDGGRPVRDMYTFEQFDRTEEDVVSFFLGVGPAPGGSLVQTLGWGEMLPGLLPIAADPCGNYVCLDTRRGGDAVVFWDHEEGWDEPDDSNLFPIAPDFQTFLDSLVEAPPIELPDPPPRWRRFLRRVIHG